MKNYFISGGKCYILAFSWSDLLPIQQRIISYPKWNRYLNVLLKEDHSSNDKCEMKRVNLVEIL